MIERDRSSRRVRSPIASCDKKGHVLCSKRNIDVSACFGCVKHSRGEGPDPEGRAHKEGERVGEGDWFDKQSSESRSLAPVLLSSGAGLMTEGETKYFVLDCVDCPVGLPPLQQAEWDMSRDHPFPRPPEIKADDYWWQALSFERDHSAKEVDRHRQKVIIDYSRLAVDLQKERIQWFEEVLGPFRKMMRNVHGPLIERIVVDTKFEDVAFAMRLQKCFQVAGHLDKSHVGVVPETRIDLRSPCGSFGETGISTMNRLCDR